jgi:hypothetical protein
MKSLLKTSIFLGAFLFGLNALASGFNFVSIGVGEAYGHKERGIAIDWGTNELSIGSATCLGLGTISSDEWSLRHRAVFKNAKKNTTYACSIMAENQSGEVIHSLTQYVGLYTGRPK